VKPLFVDVSQLLRKVPNCCQTAPNCPKLHELFVLMLARPHFAHLAHLAAWPGRLQTLFRVLHPHFADNYCGLAAALGGSGANGANGGLSCAQVADFVRLSEAGGGGGGGGGGDGEGGEGGSGPLDGREERTPPRKKKTKRSGVRKGGGKRSGVRSVGGLLQPSSNQVPRGGEGRGGLTQRACLPACMRCIECKIAS
jgi:hypothetical protein